MAATKQKNKSSIQGPQKDLSEVAKVIAKEVAGSDEKGQETTLRGLLQRCGYERRSAQTVRRLEAALGAVGVQCLPPPAGVAELDDVIQLCKATSPQKGTGAVKKTDAKTSKSVAKEIEAPQAKQLSFDSLEEMLLHARRATVLIKLADGHGSGLVVDASGLVLTARHVVEDSETVCIRAEDGSEYKGRVLLSDAALDYAFLQGEPRDDFFTLHNDMHLSVGQPVYAVGTPMQADLAGSVSRGIISSLDRIVGGVNYIQNDTTIHAGHSGGPLLTKDGDVVGINLWGRPEEGIRFALPMHYILQAWQMLQPQLGDLDARLYCTDCGFLNGPESWIVCSSWLCCGHCGTVLGDLKADALRETSDCEKTASEEIQADQMQSAKTANSNVSEVSA